MYGLVGRRLGRGQDQVEAGDDLQDADEQVHRPNKA
jgi:hypothetical protein